MVGQSSHRLDLMASAVGVIEGGPLDFQMWSEIVTSEELQPGWLSCGPDPYPVAFHCLSPVYRLLDHLASRTACVVTTMM